MRLFSKKSASGEAKTNRKFKDAQHPIGIPKNIDVKHISLYSR